MTRIITMGRRPHVRTGTDWFTPYDPMFRRVLRNEAGVVRVARTDAHEGPVYVAAENALYFTTLAHRLGATSRRASIARLALDGDPSDLDPDRLATLSNDTKNPNGMTLGRDGSLVVSDQGTLADAARIARVDPRSGATTTIVDSWNGLRLNSPNDVVERSGGSIWFTDPSYGYLQDFRPEPEAGDYVYRYDTESGRLSVVDDAFDKPNGLAFSPDEGTLYVTDSGANQREGSYHVGRPHHIIAFDVVDGRYLAGRRLFAITASGFPDGLKVDTEGRVFASSPEGVLVYEPTGHLIGRINLPGAVNFTFGGVDGNVLYVTTDDAIWAASLNARGMT